MVLAVDRPCSRRASSEAGHGHDVVRRRWLWFGESHDRAGRGLGIGLVVGDQERGQTGGARMFEHEPPEAIAQRAVELAKRLVRISLIRPRAAGR